MDRFYWTSNLRRSKKLQQEGRFLGALPQEGREGLSILNHATNLRRFLCWIFLKSLEDSRALLFTSCLSTVRQPSCVKEHPKFKLRSSPAIGSWYFPGFSLCPLQKKIHSYGSHSQQKRPKNQPLGAATSHQVIQWRGVSHSMLLFWPSSMARKSAMKALPPKKGLAMTPNHFKTNAGRWTYQIWSYNI